MGGQNAGSSESFLLMLKQSPNVKLMGEHSRGSSGNSEEYKLSNGVAVLVPSRRSTDPAGNALEGKGIKPDIEINLSAAAYINDDPLFEKAIQYFKK